MNKKKLNIILGVLLIVISPIFLLGGDIKDMVIKNIIKPIVDSKPLMEHILRRYNEYCGDAAEMEKVFKQIAENKFGILDEIKSLVQPGV